MLWVDSSDVSGSCVSKFETGCEKYHSVGIQPNTSDCWADGQAKH